MGCNNVLYIVHSLMKPHNMKTERNYYIIFHSSHSLTAFPQITFRVPPLVIVCFCFYTLLPNGLFSIMNSSPLTQWHFCKFDFCQTFMYVSLALRRINVDLTWALEPQFHPTFVYTKEGSGQIQLSPMLTEVTPVVWGSSDDVTTEPRIVNNPWTVLNWHPSQQLRHDGTIFG